MESLHNIIMQSLENKKAMVEVTIIEHHGSTPRTSGAKMIVRDDKSIAGTIGGGLYEAKAIELAHSMYSTNKENLMNNAYIMYFDLKGSAAPTDMDMVCGGDLRLLLEYIPATEENIQLYQGFSKAKNEGDECVLVTRIQAKKNDEKIDTLAGRASLGNLAHNETQEVLLAKSLIFADKATYSDFGLENITKEVEAHIAFNKSFKQISSLFTEPYEYIFEKNVKKYTLHLFGAGHVSCELAKIATYLDFKVIALDDRAEFANQARFPKANTIVLPSLDEQEIDKYLQGRTIAAQDGIIILTRGHARDRDALAAALRTKAGYFGMIGSITKRQSTYDFLMKIGYTKEDFEKVHSPIGLSIGAQTPEEIAISIAGELIQWRAGIL